MTRPTSIGSRRLSNSGGEATVTVGTIADGAVPVGTGAAGNGGAAAAGVVRQAGTDGDIQAARWLVHRGQAGRGRAAPEYNVLDRSRSLSPAGREVRTTPREVGLRLLCLNGIEGRPES